MTVSRKAIRFVRRGRVVEVHDVHPRTTLLDWLRLSQGATGTKEGCAEGDCGACTVVIGRERDGRLVYEPINACIFLLGQADGAEILTVEDLSGRSGTPSRAGGNGRSPWFAMRILHAGNRDEPLCALSREGDAPTRDGIAMRWLVISVAVRAIGRLSRPRWPLAPAPAADRFSSRES